MIQECEKCHSPHQNMWRMKNYYCIIVFPITAHWAVQLMHWGWHKVVGIIYWKDMEGLSRLLSCELIKEKMKKTAHLYMIIFFSNHSGRIIKHICSAFSVFLWSTECRLLPFGPVMDKQSRINSRFLHLHTLLIFCFSFNFILFFINIYSWTPPLCVRNLLCGVSNRFYFQTQSHIVAVPLEECKLCLILPVWPVFLTIQQHGLIFQHAHYLQLHDLH